MDSTTTDLATVKKHFELHNKTDGKSERTVGWYNEVLGLLLRWLQNQSRPTTLDTIDEMVVREFIADLQRRPGSKSTTMSSHSIYNRVNALRSFFGWLHRQGYTDRHVLEGLKQPRTSKLVIEPLNQDEIDRIFTAINPDTILGARNTAIVTLMVDAGLRLSEVASLKLEDVHLESRYVKVMGKGASERIVSFGSLCQMALMRYAHRFRPGPAHDGIDTYFLAIDGFPMTPDAIKSMVKRIAVTANLRRLHPHLLRHTYATMFLLNGGDVFLLKQNLGHTTLEMVENYLHIANRIAAVKSQQFSPLDRIGIKKSRRFRHGLNSGHTVSAPVYPNAGGSKRNGRYRVQAKA